MEAATQKEGAVSSEVAFSFDPSEPFENEAHERFVQELLMMKPQVRAYLKAFPDCTYNSAAASSTRLLRDDKITARLEYLREEQRGRLKMGSDEIHQRLVMAANCDLSDVVDGTGRLLVPLNDLSPEVRLCIESFEAKDNEIKVKFISKTKALEMLGRHRKMFADRLDVNVRHTLEELVGGGEE